MKSIEQIKEIVRSYIIDTTYGDKTKISDGTLIFKDGFFDSMGFVILISFLEEKFSVLTTDNDLIEENFESIEAISKYVAKKIGSN
jgi:acyl carrier protein